MHLSLTPFCYLLLHRVSVQRRDRRTALNFPCDFLRSHSVSVQRRDRSLFFLLHCSTKVRFCLCSDLSRRLCFLSGLLLTTLFTVCLSKDVAGALFLLILLAPFLFPLLSSLYTVCLSKDVTGALFLIFLILIIRKTPSFFRCFLQVSQCVCPKT